MDEAVWLATVFGPILTILGFWFLTRPADFHKVWASVKESMGLIYFGGVINLLVGFFILSLYREWGMNLTVLVTLLGYLQVVRGLMVLFCPDCMMKFTSKLVKSKSAHLIGLVPFVWGLALLWLGFSS